MKRLVSILICFYSLIFSAQVEKEVYNKVSSTFMSLYNSKSYDAIFLMFNEDMKKALPKEKTIAFFSNNVSPAGQIKNMDFTGEKHGAYVYKSTFEAAIFDISISLDNSNLISGLLISSHKKSDSPKLVRNSTKMILPFKDQWFVFWGGETVAQNYHMADESQQYAYDLLMVAGGTSHKGDAKKNENYFVFGKEIIAPCNAKVVKVINGVHDNVPGVLNPKQLTGNTIVLETIQKEYILFAHLKENSILVKEGDLVKQGETIAQCGNSGNSTEAHLHLQLQNVLDFYQATGAKLYFDNIVVNGKKKQDYIPVKEDFIKNIN